MTTAVIVQARMGSTRLPGKVLMDLDGGTVLAHVLERCGAISGIDAVGCCVPEGVNDDPVAEEAALAGAQVTRGPERDVLARYLIAARRLGADTIMRVTSDCPLIDPALCGEVLNVFKAVDGDIVCNDLLPLWPHGLGCEVFSRVWLERAERESASAYDHEHVSTFIYAHPAARVWNLLGPGGADAHHRWTLDTPEDFDLIRAVVRRLPAGREGWDWRAALAIVESDPELSASSRTRDRREAA